MVVQRVIAYSLGNTSTSTDAAGWHDALLPMLDALVDLRSMVPAETARKLFPEFAAQSLILLVRSPDADQQTLLGVFDEAKSNWNWLAVGNVLLKGRVEGFAARLLAKLTQHMTVSVVDSGFGGGSGGGGGECGFSLRSPKTGWPPVGLYQLTQFPERIPWLTTTFLVDGPTAVFYLRSETGNYDNPPDDQGACDGGDRDHYRAQYLTKLLPTYPGQPLLDPYLDVTIQWKGQADFQQQVLTAVQGWRNAFRGVVGRLREPQPLLTAEEAASLNPRIEILIRDWRSDRSAPLPTLPTLDGVVLLGQHFSVPLP